MSVALWQAAQVALDCRAAGVSPSTADMTWAARCVLVFGDLSVRTTRRFAAIVEWEGKRKCMSWDRAERIRQLMQMLKEHSR